MKNLRISPDLSLPLDMVTSTLIVYGGKGMGKTVFGAVLAEELAAARMRWAWLDPLGVGWGIRHSADGAGPGVECLILGGTHGDIPIEPDGGAAVADVVVEESCNVLVDFSRKPSGEMWGVGEKIRFVTAYGRRLFQRQGDLINGRRRDPLCQFLDEGARFIPQTIPAGNPDLAKCVAVWQQFVEEGRNVGLGLVVLTQRSARINKDMAELADAMVAFRTIGPNSLDAVLDWLGEHVEKARIKELSAQVRELPRGSALIVSPGWLKVERVVPIRMRQTFDSSATPKPGERLRATKGEGAKPDLAKIRERMAETVERAKADDPKALRKRIAELESKLNARTVELPEPVRVEVQVPAPVDWKKLARHFERTVDIEIARLRETCLNAIVDGEMMFTGGMFVSQFEGRAPVLSSQPVARSAPKPSKVLGKGVDELFPPARDVAHRDPKPGKLTLDRRILTILAQHRESGMTRDRLAVHLGMHPRAKSYSNTVSALRSAGHVEDYAITEAGLRHLGPIAKLPTGAALFEWWCREKLAPAEARILHALSERDDWGRDSLADRLGVHPRAKGFSNTISKLRGLSLVDGYRMSKELA